MWYERFDKVAGARRCGPASQEYHYTLMNLWNF